jgi:hypothetical protein
VTRSNKSRGMAMSRRFGGRRMVNGIAPSTLFPLLLIAHAPIHGQQPPRTWITMESALLGQASDITLGPDRSLYVVDRLNANVLVFSADGVLQRTVGREGSGPGPLTHNVAKFCHNGYRFVHGYDEHLPTRHAEVLR